MHIKRVTIQNVRRFGAGRQGLDLELPAHGWVVFAGTNGSGKTTVLQSIGHALLRSPPDDSLLGLFGWLRRGATRGSAKLLLNPAADDGWVTESDDLSGKAAGDELPLEDQWQTVGTAMSHGRESDQNRAFNGPWSVGARGWLSAGYGAQRRVVGHAEAAAQWMEGELRSGAFVTLFRSDASLVHPIRWLMDQHYQTLDGARTDSERTNATATIRAVLAVLKDGLLPKPMTVEGVSSKGLTVKSRDGTYDLLELGAGVQAVLALVVDLLRQVHLRFGRVDVVNGSGPPRVERSGVVLIDEPELHLHVSWQQELGFWLTRHFPKVQFIVATHSPFVCQAAAPGGLIRLFPAGASRAAEVASHDLYRTVVNGAVDEAVLSALFEMEHSYSGESEALRDELAGIEARELKGKRLTARERKRAEELRALLPSSGLERVEQLRRRADALP